MKDIFSGAEKILGEIKKQRASAQSASVNAERLPYELTKAYKEKADPALKKQINQAEQDTLSAGIVGLDKYQGIENPFTRRALAEKYQGSVSAGYKNLLSEQDRRQGVIQDYINMWAGTYGAIAKGEQMKLEGLNQEYNTTMDLATKRESIRQFNVKQASKGSAEFRQDVVDNLAKSAGDDGYIDPDYYKQVRDIAYAKAGMSRAQFDAQFGKDLNPKDYAKLGIETKNDSTTPKQQIEDRYYSLLNEIQSGKNKDYQIDDKGNIVQYDDGGYFGRESTKIIIRKP